MVETHIILNNIGPVDIISTNESNKTKIYKLLSDLELVALDMQIEN